MINKLFGLTVLIVTGCSYGQNQIFVKQIDSSINNSRNYIIYKWEDDLCEYTAKYDSATVSHKQLQNTLDLCCHSSRFTIQTKTTAYSQIIEINQLNIDSLDCECARKLMDLKSLDILNTNYFKDIKTQTIAELELDCKFERLAMLAYKYPDTLNFVENPVECQKYINALIVGGEELLKVWKEFHVYYTAKYGENKIADEEFEKNYSSIDRFKYAQIDLITYGWWNCINQTIPRAKNDNFHDEFIKNLIDIKEKCTEP